MNLYDHNVMDRAFTVYPEIAIFELFALSLENHSWN